MMKVVKIILIIFILIINLISYQNITIVNAETKTEQEIEKQLNENVESTLNELDFTALDNYLIKLTENDKIFFSSSTFLQKVKQILSGEFADGYESIGKALINLFFENLLNIVPMLSLIVAIAILSSLFANSSSDTKGVGEIIHLVCFGTIAVIVVKCVCDLVVLTTGILTTIATISDIIFPIILTSIVAMGGVVSASAYSPAILIFCNVLIKIFATTLVSLFVASFVFSLVSCFSTKLKFKKFSEFFSSVFKWILGIVFFLFMTYLALQGITASTVDSMKIKTAKFAVRSYVPLLGGYLSEGFDFIMSSLGLVKNAVGVGAILLLLSVVIAPIFQMIVLSLGLKLVGAICEPISDERITSFINQSAKSITLLITLIVGVSFCFVIICGMMVLTFNNI